MNSSRFLRFRTHFANGVAVALSLASADATAQSSGASMAPASPSVSVSSSSTSAAPTLPAPSAAAAPAGSTNAAVPGAGAANQDPAGASAADAQAEALALQTSQELNTVTGPKLNLYGFADFSYYHLITDRHKPSAASMYFPSFYVGNLDLYLDATAGNNWRSLSEVRFTYLPDGGQVSLGQYTANPPAPVNGVYGDYNDFNRAVRVGGIIIERAWVEYMAHPLFTLRAGQFLTPYGIWNVDHGSTVYIGTTRPFIVGQEFFPNHQTGLEGYGSYGFGSHQVGYHLTVSNGRGPVDTYKDLDNNKAVGWRVWYKNDSPIGTVTIGTSGYKGRYTDCSSKLVWTATEYSQSFPIKQRYDELALSADLKWTWKGLLLQGEVSIQEKHYAEGGRADYSGLGQPFWLSDARTEGFYVIGGYRTPWLGIMPYFGGEYMNYGSKIQAVFGGLNIRPLDWTVVKLQATHVWFPGNVLQADLDQFIAQVAWSF